ncbi:MAG: hypothetical protein ACYC99_11880 [Candidatus Geothermincolia bacterium]
MRRTILFLVAVILVAGVCLVPLGPTGLAGTFRQADAVVMDGSSSSSPVWYLAEGSTAWGFHTRISIENANNERLHAHLTYMTRDGKVDGGIIALAAESQMTVYPGYLLGETDFSTRVECVEGKNIAVDRTMSWGPYYEPYFGQDTIEPVPSPEEWWEEAHSSIGVTTPATTWYLPEGCSAYGFETWLLIQNPNTSKAKCALTYMIEGAAPVTVTKEIPGNSRASFNMFDDIGAENASIKVVADVPVIPERATYRDHMRSGSDSIGTTTPAPDWYLAEGTTAWGFDTYLLVQNPGTVDAEVQVECQTPQGPLGLDPFTVPASSRKTIYVNEVLPSADVSFHVHGSVPIVAERSMYWDTGIGVAGHSTIGTSAPHRRFYLPDGDTGESETWTLVENPNDKPVTIQIAYLGEQGWDDVWFTDTIAARSRKSFNMFDHMQYGRAAIMVTSMNMGRNIMVERSMYFYGRMGGTNTIGAWSD